MSSIHGLLLVHATLSNSLCLFVCLVGILVCLDLSLCLFSAITDHEGGADGRTVESSPSKQHRTMLNEHGAPRHAENPNRPQQNSKSSSVLQIGLIVSLLKKKLCYVMFPNPQRPVGESDYIAPCHNCPPLIKLINPGSGGRYNIEQWSAHQHRAHGSVFFTRMP